MQQKANKQKKFLDMSSNKQQQNVACLSAAMGRSNTAPVLFSKGRKSDAFFTEDSKKYITPREFELMRGGARLDRGTGKWDSLSSRVVRNFQLYQPSYSNVLMQALQRRYSMLSDSAIEASESIIGHFSMVRLWNMSIVGSILLGMMMMTFVYKYLGQGAAADQLRMPTASGQQANQQSSQDGKVLGDETEKNAPALAQQVAAIEKISKQQALEKEIRAMVKGYPIENQVPYIAQQDRTVAAFYIAIAKKESGWGQHHPVINGLDCYNYVGYRGQRKLMGSGGHTCFNSPQDAVETVAKRIKTLVQEDGKTTPETMVKTWKCGGNCAATGGQAAADKWAIDVRGIFEKFKTAK